MPKCKICGGGVKVATMYHDDCLLEAFEDMADAVCEKLCKMNVNLVNCGLGDAEKCPLTVFERKVFGE